MPHWYIFIKASKDIFYYNNKNYDKTIEYLEKTDMNTLSPEAKTEGKFRLGYAYFTKKEFG